MAEKKTLQQWLNFIDEVEAPTKLNEEFNRTFHTKGIQYPMKLFSTYMLRKEIEKGNLAAIRLEATMKGTLKAEPEQPSETKRTTYVVPIDTAEAMVTIKERGSKTPEDSAEAEKLLEELRQIRGNHGDRAKVAVIY